MNLKILQINKLSRDFFQSTDISVVGGLRSGDTIYHLDKYYDSENQSHFFRKIKWIVQYTPVFFKRSGNWAVRACSRPQNAEHEQRTEYLYVNHLCIQRYYFPLHILAIIQKEKADDQMQSMLNQLEKESNEPDFQFIP